MTPSPTPDPQTPLTTAMIRELAPLGWESSYKRMEIFALNLEQALTTTRQQLEEMRKQNEIFRQAQKACETCDAPTMAALAASQDRTDKNTP